MALGRTENANIQKREAVGIYHSFLRKDRMSSEEKADMRNVMKAHKAELFPALSGKGKIMFVIALYFPFVYRWYIAIRHGKQKNQGIW